VLARLEDRARLTVGYELLHQKRYADAIGQFAVVPQSSPIFDEALFGIGWGYFKLEEYVRAAAIFKDLRQRFPNSPYSQEALVALGFAYSRLQAFKLSIDHFRQALDDITNEAQTIQGQIDGLNQPAWAPPAALSRFPVVSGMSSQVQIDDLQKYFREEAALETALARYQELAGVLATIDAGQQDLARVAQSPSAWLANAENKQRVSSLQGGYQTARRQALALQASFKKSLSTATAHWLEQQLTRLEENSVQASIGIARNLVLDTAGLQEGL